MQHRSRLLPLGLSADQRRQLQRLARRVHSARALAVRARIVLCCGRGRTNREVARRLGVTCQTVGKWRRRFAARGIQGLQDDPRTGAPRLISDELVEVVLAKTLHERPPDARRWSSRRLAAVLGISQQAVLRIWRAFGV